MSIKNILEPHTKRRLERAIIILYFASLYNSKVNRNVANEMLSSAHDPNLKKDLKKGQTMYIIIMLKYIHYRKG